MLEDLFNVVKTRFNISDNGENAEKTADKEERSVEIPKDLAFKCPRCLNMIMTDELVKNLKVCPKCGYHSRISAGERLSITADKDSFIEFDTTDAFKPVTAAGFVVTFVETAVL